MRCLGVLGWTDTFGKRSSNASMISVLSCIQRPSGVSTVGMIAAPTAFWMSRYRVHALGATSVNGMRLNVR